jgi:hypothetical protein
MTSSAERSNSMDGIRGNRVWWLAAGVSLGTALLLILPFFWLGNASGHDFGFHAASWLDGAGQWKEGIFFPRWTEWANHGFGEPRFIFYPPLSWMLGAALGSVLPWNAVPGAFILIVQTLAGLSAFALARRFLPDKAALVGAVCYAANPYALVIIYMRSDFAELLACAFMPLVVLTALHLSGLAEIRRRSWPRSMGLFGAAFAAVWLSNAPAGVLGSYSVALIFAWAVVEEKTLRPLWRGAGGLALGFGLMSFYLLPAAYEQRWVNITQALSSGLQPADNFLYTMTNDPEHTVFNWIASSAAVLLIVMTGVAGIAARRETVQEGSREETKKLWRVMLVLSAVAVILMIRPSAFFWALLPKLRFVQFPWRWMAILAVPYAYFFAGAIAEGRRKWLWVVALILVSASTATFLLRHAWWDSEDIPMLRGAIAADQGYEGTDEYDPLGDDHYNLPEKAPRIEILPAEESAVATPQAEIRIERWTAEERNFRVTSKEPLRLALRLLNYPAWRVEVNGKVVTPRRAETDGSMVLPLPAGSLGIMARFERTADRKAGMAISITAVLILLALLNAGGVRLLSASP